MNQIWANRIIAGTRFWSEVPEFRKEAVLAILKVKVSEIELNRLLSL